ncbi:MAG: ClpX C4-type zinc finger protein, partial [Chitinophagales bacterium]
MKKKETAHCSFCLRPKEEVKMLIAGQEGHICETCVSQAQTLVEEE